MVIVFEELKFNLQTDYFLIFQIRKFSIQIFVLKFEIHARRYFTINWGFLKRVISPQLICS